MLAHVEKKYFPGEDEHYDPTDAERDWLTYFVGNYLGGTDLRGRYTKAQFDWRCNYILVLFIVLP